MKELRSRKMRSLLRQGLREARRCLRPPSEGMLVNLFSEDLSNGWHYQVDYIHDLRFRPKPYVAVFAFRPPRRHCAASASHVLISTT